MGEGGTNQEKPPSQQETPVNQKMRSTPPPGPFFQDPASKEAWEKQQYERRHGNLVRREIRSTPPPGPFPPPPTEKHATPQTEPVKPNQGKEENGKTEPARKETGVKNPPPSRDLSDF